MTTQIDDTWLAAHGGADGPWSITTAGTYELAADPTALGTGFLVKVAGVTLDLKGRTVTFGNRANPVVLNPYFSDNVTVPGLPDHWDVTGAPTASVVPITDHENIKYGFRDWAVNCLKLTAYTTAQVIVSEAVAITTAFVEYTFSAFAKNVVNGSSCTMKLEVLDNVTGATLVSYTTSPSDPGSGYMAPVTVLPITTNALKLRITMTPTNGVATTGYLSAAFLEQTRDYGILATAQFAGPAAVVTAASNASPIVITSASHALQTGRYVSVSGVLGNTAANGYHIATKIDANNFSLNGSVGNGAYASGGIWAQNGGIGAAQITATAKIASPLITGIGGSPKYTQLSSTTAAFTLKDTVGGGKIISGKDGFLATPLKANNLATLIVTGTDSNRLILQSEGMDAPCLYGSGCKAVTVTGVRTIDAGTRVSNRQHQFGSIDFSGAKAATINRNTVGGKMSGVYGTGEGTTGPGQVIVTDNDITIASRYADNYSITLANLKFGATITDNRVTTTEGRGIFTDMFTAQAPLTRDVEIGRNTVNVYNPPNLEFGRGGERTNGIRWRNHVNQQMTNYYVHHNTVTVLADATSGVAAIGIRPSQRDGLALGNHRIEYNTVKAINNDLSIDDGGSINNRDDTASRSTYAAAFSMDQSYPPGGLTFIGNVWESNDIAVSVGDKDAYQEPHAGLTFRGDTIKRNLTEGNQNIAFLPVVIGDFTNEAGPNVNFFGFDFVNTTSHSYDQDPLWGDDPFDKEVDVGWLVAVTLTDSITGAPLLGASCVVKNTSGAVDDTQTTDAGGLASVAAITDHWHQPGTNAGGRTRTTFGPHTLTISVAGYITQIVSLGTLSANATRSVTLVPLEVPLATGYTITAPSPASGGTGVASGEFVLAPSPPGSVFNLPFTVTVSDGGAGGTFSDSTIDMMSAAAVAFTYTPSSGGTKTISTTNNGGYANPAAVNYLATTTGTPVVARETASFRTVATGRTPATNRIPR